MAIKCLRAIKTIPQKNSFSQELASTAAVLVFDLLFFFIPPEIVGNC